MESELNHPTYIAMAADIVAAYVSNNQVSVDNLGSLIAATYSTLTSLQKSTAPAVAAEQQKPAVSPKKSIQPDFIICLEDGRKFKSLKRHLRTKYDMSPEQYRAKWDLPKDYPMVAPSYAAARSNLAKAAGLGQTGGRKKSAAKKAAR